MALQLIAVIIYLGLNLAVAESTVNPSTTLPKNVQSLSAPGIHNLFLAATNVYSGSSPENNESFAALANLGIKTIISVDGAKPFVELAKKHGIRYVHIPHGYDGIKTNTQALLIKATDLSKGSVYIHCHHGKHRGPAAVAVVCMGLHNWTQEEAQAWLITAGTATNYTGLYDAVRDFKKPGIAHIKTLPDELPEVALISGLTETMVEIDRHWENLKAVQAAGYAQPQGHPDLKPANEALILSEHYREAQRLAETSQKGAHFLDLFKIAEAEAKDAEGLLISFSRQATPETRHHLDRTFKKLAKSCTACHQTHRDRAL